MTLTDPSLLNVLQIVFNSKRAMPAHFSGDETKSKSFFVDYDKLTPDDEYEIASQVYHIMWEFLGKVPEDQITKSDASCVLKIGEDIALGAFILQKEDEYASFSDLRQETIEENVDLWDNPQLEKIVKIPLVQNYFDFCGWFGRARANGFRWGNQPVKGKKK